MELNEYLFSSDLHHDWMDHLPPRGVQGFAVCLGMGMVLLLFKIIDCHLVLERLPEIAWDALAENGIECSRPRGGSQGRGILHLHLKLRSVAV